MDFNAPGLFVCGRLFVCGHSLRDRAKSRGREACCCTYHLCHLCHLCRACHPLAPLAPRLPLTGAGYTVIRHLSAVPDATDFDLAIFCHENVIFSPASRQCGFAFVTAKTLWSRRVRLTEILPQCQGCVRYGRQDRLAWKS